MADPTTAWLNALAFLAGYGAAELQHRIRKHLRSMGPPRGSYGLPPDHDWRRSFNHENRHGPVGPPPLKLRRSGDPGAIRPTTPKPEIIPKPQYPPAGCERWFIDDPVTIAECGGPCTAGPKHCDCGALWVDVLK